MSNGLNYCVNFIVNIIYTCGRRPHDTSWQSAGWTLKLVTEQLPIISDPGPNLSPDLYIETVVMIFV